MAAISRKAFDYKRSDALPAFGVNQVCVALEIPSYGPKNIEAISGATVAP